MTQKFSLKPEDLSNTLVHLTNFAVNKNAEFLGDYPPGCQVSVTTNLAKIVFSRITSGLCTSSGLGCENEARTQSLSGAV